MCLEPIEAILTKNENLDFSDFSDFLLRFQFLMMGMDGGCGGYFFVLEQKISILESKYAGKHVSEPAEPL